MFPHTPNRVPPLLDWRKVVLWVQNKPGERRNFPDGEYSGIQLRRFCVLDRSLGFSHQHRSHDGILRRSELAHNLLSITCTISTTRLSLSYCCLCEIGSRSPVAESAFRLKQKQQEGKRPLGGGLSLLAVLVLNSCLPL